MYTIGAFSKLCHISPRMLRYYDSLGLLAPARVDPETGYRYYDSAQLGRLERIQRLSAYGFPLSQVEERWTWTPPPWPGAFGSGGWQSMRSWPSCGSRCAGWRKS